MGRPLRPLGLVLIYQCLLLHANLLNGTFELSFIDIIYIPPSNRGLIQEKVPAPPGHSARP